MGKEKNHEIYSAEVSTAISGLSLSVYGENILDESIFNLNYFSKAGRVNPFHIRAFCRLSSVRDLMCFILIDSYLINY